MPKESRRITMEPLRGSKRGIATLVGLNGLVAGGTAVFESSNQAGTVALLSIGAVAGVVALLGKIPLRWVVAGTEVDMSYESAEETVEALSSVLTTEQMKSTASQLLEQSPGSGSDALSYLALAASLTHSSAVEEQGHRQMRRLAQLNGNWSYEEAAPDSGADGFMTAPDGSRVAVVFKAWAGNVTSQRRRQRIRLMEQQLAAILRMTRANGLLLVTEDPASSWLYLRENADRQALRMRVVSFSDTREAVQGTLLELFNLASPASEGEEPH